MKKETNPNTDIKLSLKEDIHLSDKEIWNNFQQYYLAGQYEEAINYLNNNLSSVKNKITNATLINNLNNALVILQNYYYNNVEDKLSELMKSYDDEIENFVNKGVYTIGVTYYPLNFVFDNNGNLYICIKENTGKEDGLNDVTNWIYIGLKGEKGLLGFNCTYKGVWDSTTTYSKNDLCTDGDYLYYSKQNNNLNNNPSPNSQYWGVFFEFIKATIEVYTQTPTTPYPEQVYLLQV